MERLTMQDTTPKLRYSNRQPPFLHKKRINSDLSE